MAIYSTFPDWLSFVSYRAVKEQSTWTRMG